MNDVTAQATLLQQAAAAFIDGVKTFALRSKETVALNQVLTQMHLGTGVRKTAGAIRTATFVIV